MIKNISTTGRYMQVQGGSSSGPYISPGAQSAGMLRYNTSNSNIEVYDGQGWREYTGSYTTLGLTPEAEMILDWARDERYRQQQRDVLIKSNPALQKAYDAIKRAEENFDILSALVEEEHKYTELA